MSVFGIFKKLRPAERVAMFVDAVADRMNDKYELQGEARMTEGGMKFTMRIVDVKPETTIPMPERDD